VRRIERVMIEALAEHGVEAGTIEGWTGVWTPEPRKIGSIGIHVSRGVTTHGLAVNVNNDLQPFEWIVPCGIDDCRMTSLSRELREPQDLGEFAATLTGRFAEVYEREPLTVTPADLAAEVEGISALAQGAGAGAVR
jgi:lipoyl(octanoyl) transferase